MSHTKKNGHLLNIKQLRHILHGTFETVIISRFYLTNTYLITFALALFSLTKSRSM